MAAYITDNNGFYLGALDAEITTVPLADSYDFADLMDAGDYGAAMELSSRSHLLADVASITLRDGTVIDLTGK
jgi:hypothetical protein